MLKWLKFLKLLKLLWVKRSDFFEVVQMASFFVGDQWTIMVSKETKLEILQKWILHFRPSFNNLIL